MSACEKDSTTAADENMRATASKLGGGRALSTPTRANSTPPSNGTWSPNNGIVFSGTWSPNHGIVFRPAAGTPRSMSTNALEDIRQGQLLHSQAEDDYVMASADATVLERQSTMSTKAMAGGDLKGKSTPSPKTSKDQKAPEGKAPTTKPDSIDSKQKEALKSSATTPKDPKGAKASESTLDSAGQSSDTNAPELQAQETKAQESKPDSEPEDPAQNTLPETTTTLKMTEELFRAAKNAEPGSMESYWSHRLYRGPLVNGKHQKTTVHYCKSIHTTERVLKLHFAKSKVIGFDIEWKENAYRSNDARQNVSLIQIANEERVALFHVALYPKNDLVSPTFKRMMEDNSITKVGVSIKADCTRLRKYLGIDTKGMLELSHLYKLVKFSERKEFGEINRRLVSLSKQTQEHLHLPMYKGDVRISDWSKKLSLEQIMYAASDSYAGLQLFYTLEMKRLALDPTPPRPYHAELNLPIRIAEGVEIPSDAEAEEADPEPEPEDPAGKATSATTDPKPKQLSEKELEEAKESVSMEDPELEYALFGYPLLPTTSDSEETQEEPPSLIRKIGVPDRLPKSSPSLFSSYTNPLVHAAEVQASCHLDSLHTQHPKHRLNPYHPLPSSSHSAYHLRGRNLRTYFLWYENPALTLKEIGSMLRSPPLSERSVAVGILEAVRVEGMRFDDGRLREVLGVWRRWGNRWVVGTRYGRLEEECGFVVGEEEDGDGELEGADCKEGETP
ncbi:hypothetical protein BKA64DRAFT_704885 [Cadophora sp. MPI-SDFR-AT-0126]|nr:hypothetical protein BKA64DRAFT_704885 [Leotiomycetes sp. MPI-SDFR-AT-0126]